MSILLLKPVDFFFKKVSETEFVLRGSYLFSGSTHDYRENGSLISIDEELAGSTLRSILDRKELSVEMDSRDPIVVRI